MVRCTLRAECFLMSYPFMHTGIDTDAVIIKVLERYDKLRQARPHLLCCLDPGNPGTQVGQSGFGFSPRKAIRFQNRFPPRLIGCRSPGAEAVPLLIWATRFFRSSSLSSSEDGARGFDFLMGRTGDESVSGGGALVTLRLRAPPASRDGVGDRMRISGC